MKLSERIFKFGIFTLDTTEIYDGVIELEAKIDNLEQELLLLRQANAELVRDIEYLRGF